MLIKNIRTGITEEVSERVAKFLIATGKCVEVKKKVLKQEPEKKAEKKEEKKPTSKEGKYKTKDMKAES